MPAMDLLGSVCRRALGENARVPDLKGKRVVVLGGGDTAIDCLRCALREGALEATAVARRPQGKQRAAAADLVLALEEGAKLCCGVQLKSLEGRDGAVCAVLVTDADGNEKKLEADVVFVAYGFESLPLDGLAASGVALDDQGRIVTDGGCAASVSGVWAGGATPCAAPVLPHRRLPTGERSRGPSAAAF